MSQWAVNFIEKPDLRVFELEINGFSSSHECLSTVVIYDGFDDSAPELMRSCGTQRPGSIMSTGNGIFIKFNAISFEAHEGSKFKLSWRKIDEASRIRYVITYESRTGFKA